MMDAARWKPLLAAVLASVMVSFIPLLSRGLYAEGLSPASLLFYRYALALVTLLAVGIASGHQLAGAFRNGGLKIAALGATLGSAQTFLFFEAIRHLDTGIAILIFYTYPVLTMTIERVVFRRALPGGAVGAAMLILFGAALVASSSGLGADPIGLMWIFPSPLLYSIYLICNARLMRQHAPIPAATCLYAGFTISFVVAVIAGGLELPQSASGWAAVIFIAIGAGALTTTLFSYCVPRLGASSYAIVANLELVSVVALGVVLLGEPMDARRGAGTVCVVGGVLLYGLLQRRAGSRRR